MTHADEWFEKLADLFPRSASSDFLQMMWDQVQEAEKTSTLLPSQIYDMTYMLAAHPNTPLLVLREILRTKHQGYQLYAELTKNPVMTAELLIEACDLIGVDEVPHTVPSHPNVTAGLLKQLSVAKYWGTR